MGLPFVCVCSLVSLLLGALRPAQILLELVFSGQRWGGAPTSFFNIGRVRDDISTTDVLTIDALNSLRRLFFAKLFYPHVDSTEELVCSRLLLSSLLAHLNFLSGVNCYDISSTNLGCLSGNPSFPPPLCAIPGQLIMQMGDRLWASVEGAPMMEQQLLSSSQPPVARPTILPMS